MFHLCHKTPQNKFYEKSFTLFTKLVKNVKRQNTKYAVWIDLNNQ